MWHLYRLFLLISVTFVVALTSGIAHAESSLPASSVLETHTISDHYGRPIIYHISRPAKPAPLLLVIQGSGCGAVLQGVGASAQSNLYDLQGFAAEGRFAVMAVEKPFARAEASGGSAEACGQKFNEDFTVERWLVALRAAIADARRDPIVDHRRFMVIGMSEGAVMASLLAQADKGVTDVAAIGGSGTTQIFDFMVRAYTDCFDRSVCIAEIDQQLSAIRGAPDSATQFAWGHPYRRWSSFFAVDPGTALLQSKARVYLAFGTADESTPPLSQEVAVAKLLAAGRDVTVRRVIAANHGLMLPGQDFSALEHEYRRIFDWFWSSAPRSVLHD
jgi:dienelactone hydrolase